MPKLGRRSERGAIEHTMAKDLLLKEAPFGTADTPTLTMKLIGGNYHAVIEKHAQYNDNYHGSRIQQLHPVADKPNHLDPRTYGDMPGGYYNKDVQFLKFRCCCRYECRCNKHDDDPTAFVNKRPDSKDVARTVYKALPPIQANRTRNDMSTVFECEPWTDNRSQPLARETEHTYNFRRENGEENGMDEYYRSNGPNDNLFVSESEKDQLYMLLTPNVLLPVDPIKLIHDQETTLCKLVCGELEGFDPATLRDVYVECSQHDKDLRGVCGIEIVEHILKRHKAFLSDKTLRIIAAQFVDSSYPGRVNYEKVLSFIGSALQMNAKGQLSNDKPKYYMQNGETTQTGSIYKTREVNKLLEIVQMELSKNESSKRPYVMDWTRWHNAFEERDRDHRETLSASQIKDICYAQNLPLSDSILNSMLSLCEDNNRDGQYKWNEFLKLLGRVRPMNTGLPIPKRSSPRRDVSPRRGDNRPDNRQDKYNDRDRYSPHRNNNHARSRDRTPPKYYRERTPSQERYKSPTEMDDRYNDRRDDKYREDRGRRDGYRDEQRGYQPSWQQHQSPGRSRSPPPARRINERFTELGYRSDDPRHTDRRDHGHESYRDQGRESQRDQGRESHRDQGRTSQTMNREDHIRQLSNQLKDLETKYQVTREGMHSNELPWLERYLKMAQALYNSDVSSRGSVPRKDVMEIVRQYNDAFSLNLDMTRANMVAISPDNLDKSGNILLRPFLAGLSGDKISYKI